MQETILQMIESAGPYAYKFAGAAAILLLGWLFALLLSAMTRRVLRRTALDNRAMVWLFGEEKARAIESHKWGGKAVYYLVMLFVLVAFLQAVGLTTVTSPLNELLTQLFGYAPRLLGAIVLIAIAWLVAVALRLVIIRGLEDAKIDERFASEAELADESRLPLSKTVGNVAYWLVFFIFLPAILGALALEGLLSPVQGMMDKFLGFLPNILAALAILAIGWFAARILHRLVARSLAGLGLDNLSENVGLSKAMGSQKLSELAGLVVYILVLIPVLIASLNALALTSLTRPASNMLNAILAAIPAIFAASLVLSIAYIIGRVVAGLVTSLMTGMGFNNILAKLGIGGELAEGRTTPSQVLGHLVLVGIMLFASIEALALLNSDSLREMLINFTGFAGQIILGLIVFGLGLYLASLAAGTLRASKAPQSGLLATTARASIIVLTGAMALRQMGVAPDIINLAFGLLLGAVALASALAFGLGARDAAGDAVKRWLDSAKSSEARD